MKQRLVVSIIVLGLLLGLLSGCSQVTTTSATNPTATTATSTSTATAESTTSATTTNPVTPTPAVSPADIIGNGGPIVQQGDWLFYSINERAASKADSGLYKIKQDGTEKTKLYKQGVGEINLLGDWIYFIVSTTVEDGTPISVDLKKIKTDGTGLVNLLTMKDNDILWMQIAGNWIYFNTYQENNLKKGQYPNNIYQMKLDGTARKLIVKNAFCNALQAEWFYGLGYRIKIDGSQKEIISKNEMSSDGFVVDGDWIFYSNTSDEARLYKIKTDGTGRVKLSDDSIGILLKMGDEIFYRINSMVDNPSADDGKLFKIKTDGTTRTEIVEVADPDKSPMLVGALNGWLYLEDRQPIEDSQTDEMPGGYSQITLYRIKTDGSARADLLSYAVANAG